MVRLNCGSICLAALTLMLLLTGQSLPAATIAAGTYLISADTNGEGRADCALPMISGDGTVVTFTSIFSLLNTPYDASKTGYLYDFKERSLHSI